jgi:rhamnogalacturonyl hydrolase YesR
VKFAEKQTKTLLENVQHATQQATLSDRSSNKPPVCPRSLGKDGSLNLVPSRDWCSGFFPGNLWFLYENTSDNFWKENAENFIWKIEQEKDNGTTHDMGFKMLCSFGNAYRITKDDRYNQVLIRSAYTLAKRFNDKVGAIRSWDHNKNKWEFPVIIDNMMNLELLFYAFNHTHDSLFYKIAVSHANVTLKNHFRSDYSSYHVVDYDSINGNAIRKSTHQGLNDSSSWSRGQGWALYGYTMCYRETKNKVYLHAAQRIAGFILNHKNLPEDKIPYFDFDAKPGKTTPRDASAAALIASALYELSLYDESTSKQYIDAANLIIKNLTNKYHPKAGGSKGFLLNHSTGGFTLDMEVDVPIIYADYYYLEALTRKKMLINKQTIDFNSK